MLFRSGQKWFGTNAGGVSRYKDGQWKTYFPMHGLADYWIYSFAQQKNGDFWIGTWAGASHFNLRTGKTHEQRLSELPLEFGMVNTRHWGRPYRYSYNMVAHPGSFLFDGITRHSPEGQWFKQYAEEQGYKEAVRLRDSGEPIPGSKSYKDY